ncbi:MAG: ATP-binding cassette domain-containing protein [Candidatus Paceibacterota bacterium]|jgi:ATPase subunit of ABC transporter with duplicated ATPase domains
MAKNETILRFDSISFEYNHNKHILDDVSFSVRRGSKITIMGQNGSGKSTIFNLITNVLKPELGTVVVDNKISIAISKQVIPREDLKLTVREFFQKCFPKKIYDIDPRIDKVLEVVNLSGHEKVHDRTLKMFSGGQQARILLASALIQNPDILLLDEPTNNLDTAGIAHLTEFLISYPKTVIVISHDSDFLNAFSDGVLYLDIYKQKIEQYVGNYKNVVKEISTRVEKENMKNAQLAKEIQAKKEKSNEFAHKGGRLRLVAKRMREKAEELEDSMVGVRKEDKTIKPFIIPCQEDLVGEIIKIDSFTTFHSKTGKISKHKTSIKLKKNQHLLLKGPNGIGKSTLLEHLADFSKEGSFISPNIRVGYYRQDFSTLNFNDTVYDSLAGAMLSSGASLNEEHLRATAASFLITGEIIRTKIGDLSEGQKGLVAFACLVLERPGLIILDEPTNHINFRHIPIIAEAINKYQGALILVSHIPEFVKKIRIDEILDLEK